MPLGSVARRFLRNGDLCLYSSRSLEYERFLLVFALGMSVELLLRQATWLLGSLHFRYRLHQSNLEANQAILMAVNWSNLFDFAELEFLILTVRELQFILRPNS